MPDTFKIVEQDGVLSVEYEWIIIRFLFDDGRTLDLRAIGDDSRLRETVRGYAKAKAIVGVAYLPLPKVPIIAESPPKKRPAKRAAPSP